MLNFGHGFRRIAGNFALLLGATGIVGACSVLSLGLNSRALGVQAFGVLSLIQAFAAVVSNVFTFDSWQPVVRLGIRLPQRLPTILAGGVILDVAAALMAACTAFIAIFGFGGMFGLDRQLVGLAAIYSLSLLGGVSGTAKGYFRLQNEFRVLAGNQVASAVAVALASALLWILGSSLRTYVVVFSILTFAYNSSLLVRMLISLRRSGVSLPSPLMILRQRRFMRVMVKMSAGSSILSTLLANRRHAALFVVGAVLGSGAAGIFSVAAKLVTAVSRLAALVNQATFADVMRAASKGEGPVVKSMLVKVSVIAAIAAICMGTAGALSSDFLVRAAGGAGYAGAAPQFSILFMAECVGLAAIHFNPVIQHWAGTLPLIRYSAISFACSLASSMVLGRLAGGLGAALGVLIGALVAYGLMAAKTSRLMRLSLGAR